MQGVCAQSFGQFQPFSLMFGVSKNHRLPSVGSNIEQRKWCRTTEIWRIGVNENVRQFFGQCGVNPRQSWMIWISRCGSRIPSTGFWIPYFRIPADFLSWTPRIPEKICRFPESGYRTLYLIRSEIPLPTWDEVVFHASPMYISLLSTHSLLSCN